MGLAGGVLLKEGGKKGSPSSDQMPTNKWSKEKKKRKKETKQKERKIKDLIKVRRRLCYAIFSCG